MTLGAIEKFIPINEEGFEPLCDKRIDWLLENVLLSEWIIKCWCHPKIVFSEILQSNTPEKEKTKP